MDASDRFIEQPWLIEGGASEVVSALSLNGGIVRFVGGCVRDALLGRTVRDIDLATDLPPEMVIERLETAGLRAIPTGVDHGTVTAVVDGNPFEITTLRRDVETHGRHATVEFTDDWLEDAKRRDFTINALYCDPDGRVFDPVGGLADLEAARVRFVGDAGERIDEDALRILRYFRFQAWFGAGDLDREAVAACAARKSALDRLSVERIRSEILRLLEAPDPLRALESMQGTGILEQVAPEATRLETLEQVIEFGATDQLIRLAALTDRRPATLEALAVRWKMSNAERNRLRRMADGEIALPADMDGPAMRAQIYWLGRDRFCDLAYLEAAHDGHDRSALLRYAEDWDAPVFSLRGGDALAVGIEAGERVGRVLAALEQEWVAEDFAADRETLLARLRNIAQED